MLYETDSSRNLMKSLPSKSFQPRMRRSQSPNSGYPCTFLAPGALDSDTLPVSTSVFFSVDPLRRMFQLNIASWTTLPSSVSSRPLFSTFAMFTHFEGDAAPADVPYEGGSRALISASVES